MSQQVQVTPITSRTLLGEAPHWIEKDQSLIYVDLLSGNIHRYFTETKRQQNLHVEDIGTGGTASFILPVEGHANEFVIGLGRNLAAIKWSPEEADNSLKKPISIALIDQHDTTTRFNDGKCDPAGRLWAGTMHGSLEPYKGSLYRFDSNLKPSTMEQKISCSNGLAWNADRTAFYYIDTLEYRVDVYDYDFTSGDISNRRCVLNTKKSPDLPGFPDGMTIDTNGHLWVAFANGSKVVCIDPTAGKVLRSVPIPSALSTSCCFGGRDYSTLFVTTGSMDISQQELITRPDTGKTFALEGLGVKGLPGNEFKVDPSCWKI